VIGFTHPTQNAVFNAGGNPIVSPGAGVSQAAVISPDTLMPVPALAVTQGSVVSLFVNPRLGAAQIPERVTRPIVEILPRTAFPIVMTINVHSNTNPAVSPLSVSMQANGIPIALPAPAATAPSPVFPGGFVTTYSVLGSALPATPVRVMVTARETAPSPFTKVPGVNVVEY
jgi:hypothetical protein